MIDQRDAPSLDLGVIGNSVLSALVDAGGRIVWYCYPRLDGDPVFCNLLDGGRQDETGFLDTEVEERSAAQQCYLTNTAILATTLTDARGQSIRIVDSVPRFHQFGRVFRPHMVLRRIEPVSGACRIRIRVRPRFDYGATAPEVISGSNHLRYVAASGAIRVTTDAPVSFLREERWFSLDAPVTLILGPDEPVEAAVPELSRSFVDRTEDYWRE